MPPTLPTINACLNGASAAFLAAGYRFIRGRKVEAHRACMLGAFVCSTLFLASYLYYHWRAGSRHFPGVGAARTFYLALLASHSLLAVAVVPLALRALFLAGKERFEEHRRLARVAFPAWMYVSVTGVAVYAMLYLIPWPTR
ncbi:MAG TPA: DUF420 domain-containing protein [Elusimicrobiota bacterium]|jgi:putative membrane protein|nr:DUF420 domain-containing protein [Elusimicrobiota bacterium]